MHASNLAHTLDATGPAEGLLANCVGAHTLHGKSMELDKLYCADSRAMREVQDGSVQLIVTSPPYNVGKSYERHDDQMAFKEYLEFLN